MNAFAGTGRLARLALRRDRVKLGIWTAAIVGLVAVAVPTLHEVYGNSQKMITEYAMTMTNSFVARLLGGPMDGPHFGSIVMMEYFLFTAVLMIFMSTLAVVRHTRQNEETGRSELIGSGMVGRYAPLTAALAVVVGVNVLISVLIAISLIAQDLPVDGSVAMAAGLCGVGVVFAAIAAVAAQIIGTARGTNAAIGGLIGVAILIRGLGDGLGKAADGGMKVESAWPSWLSPIGWGQQMEPFSQPQWWVLGVFGAAFVALVSLAYWLASHRDHGMGMIPSREGRAMARPSLLSPLGLAWRLQRSVLLGWGIGIASLGVVLGMTATEFRSFFEENEQLAAILQATGGGSNFTDTYFSAMMLFMSFLLAGYVLQAILRLQSEESSGYLEGVLATATSRFKWAASHIFVAACGVLLLGALAGLSTGIAYALVADDVWSQVSRLVGAGLVQVPAALTFAGIAMFIFGVVPRWTNVVAWAVFTVSLAVAQLGELLKLPEWIIKLSPFTHTPPAPASSIDADLLIIMAAIASGLAIVGLVAFRRRDISTE